MKNKEITAWIYKNKRTILFIVSTFCWYIIVSRFLIMAGAPEWAGIGFSLCYLWYRLLSFENRAISIKLEVLSDQLLNSDSSDLDDPAE